MEDYADVPRKADRMKQLREDQYFNAMQIKFGYAVTCHKAQGGQWAHVYLDQGYRVASQFISEHILVNVDEILRDGSWRDAKSYLQEISQRIDNETPSYRVLDESGPDHDKTFVVGVYVAGQEMGRGTGTSKQQAQQAAARQAIATYREKK